MDQIKYLNMCFKIIIISISVGLISKKKLLSLINKF